MGKKLMIFFLVSFMVLSLFTILKCGSVDGGGDESGTWGTSKWGQCTWSP